MKKGIHALLLLAVFLPVSAWAQSDTVDVPSDFGVGEGSLNNAVAAKISAGTLSNTVFRLELYGLYILTGTITVPAGTRLTIIGPVPGTTQDAAPPQIVWTSSGGVSTNFNFDCFGDITLRNVWLLYANTGGTQVGSSLQIEDSPDEVNGQHGIFDGVIFDYAPTPQNASGCVGVTARHFRGTFTNCYFRNCIDQHLRYYGRAVSFPFGTTGWHIDSLSFENCSFANLGYVYMQEGSEYGDYVSFNHCTFLNSVMFTLESGWWHWLAVTNSVFVNAYMFGDILAQRGGGMYPNGGTINFDSISTFGFSVPFTEGERHVLFANSSYYIDQWLRDYMDHGNPYSDTAGVSYKPIPQPMMSDKTIGYFADDVTWPFLSTANLSDGVDPGFILPPTNQDAIKRFLLRKWTDNSDTNWAYNPTADLQQIWPMGEALGYSNATLRTAGMNGFPLGDMRWQSTTRYNQWRAQQGTERARINQWLSTGVDPGVLAVEERPGVAEKFELSQNYPNPFNPTTKLDYSVPERLYVSLRVFNILGQEVATLFEGVQQPGNYVATFDAGSLASGVYVCRLQAGTSSVSRKLVLLK